MMELIEQMENILPLFAEYGILGLLIGYLLWANAKKDERINDLMDKFFNKDTADVDRYTQQTLLMERILMVVQGGGK